MNIIQLFIPLFRPGGMSRRKPRPPVRTIQACPDDLLGDAIRLLEKYPRLATSPRAARRLAKMKAERDRRASKRRGKDLM